MRILVTIAVLLAANAGNARLIFDNYNEIGIYTDEFPTRADAQELSSYTGPPGMFVVYVVCTNPYNPLLDEPIDRLYGFGFTLTLPQHVFLLSATWPPGGNNQAILPGFLIVGLDLPVDQRRATLLTLTLMEINGDPGYIFFNSTPHVTDRRDPTARIDGYPTSGHYTLPVFGIYEAVVPLEDSTWGGVKSLYR